ncbi:uncharacterized protein TNCV_4881181 [Trichonephila clavipes]|nr:uncharacterized protein TNCV_4881181 [Trichonephila clavipes]
MATVRFTWITPFCFKKRDEIYFRTSVIRMLLTTYHIHLIYGCNDLTPEVASSSCCLPKAMGGFGISLVTRTIVWVGRYLSHCSCKAVSNSWFLRKQDAISNKIPRKIKMDRLKLKLEIVEALSGSPPTNKSILTGYEDNSVVIPLAKRSKLYNPLAIHVMAFILAIPG